MASVVDRFKKKSRGPQQGRDWTNTGSFINKPVRGWLHPDEQLDPDAGVCYGVRYIGGMEVKQSMKTLDFETRTAIAKESISQVSDAAGLKSPGKKSKRSAKISKFLGETPNMMFAGINVNLTITTEALTIMNMDNGDIIGNHAMPSVSFASGGDADTMDFVAYVAKDPNGRACHVLECGGGLAQDVITTIGQAFELRYKMFLARKPDPLSLPDRLQNPMDGNRWGDDDEYYNDKEGAEPPLDHLELYSTPHSNAPVVSHNEKDVERDFGISPTVYDNSRTSDLINLRDSAAVYDNKSGSQGAVGGGAMPNLYDNSATKPDVMGFEVGSETAYDNRGNALPSPILGGNATYDNKHTNGFHHNSHHDEDLDAFDMSPFHTSVPSAAGAAAGPVPVGLPPPPPIKPRPLPNIAPLTQTPYNEDWFHGKINRGECDAVLADDGDFLVRESRTSAGQFVLSGRHSGQIRHLLLVDPEGIVRTKDRTFTSVSHLVNYHMERELPITSTDSELLLRNAVARKK